MRILGIDPGTNIIGWGIIEKLENKKIIPIAYSSIIIGKKNSFGEKLEIIFDNLNKIVSVYKPNIAAVEELFFVNNIKTGISVSHARGVILLALKKMNIETFEYKPLEIKQAVAGYGRADKKQVQAMVKNILKLSEVPKPDDTADALAVALCHESSMKLKKILLKK
ncbi:MAG: crossover junction endodeoxyribonuclease RuvC [Elusimicrobiota bacterium]|jgi:crossover junction endodeoxyribonuclease RuvC|nr:crossover junction endodeoxyribonuclease RuvC [Elusimicrobiota bacterium]